MAFSFNPGQSTPSSPQGSAGWGAAPGVGGVAPSTPSAPAVPNSPFLFMQQRGAEKSSVAYMQILLFVVFVIAVIASISLFSYSFYLSSSIDAKKKEILLKETSFKEYPFAEMKKTSDKIAILGNLLNEYASVRSSFRLLERVVEHQVLFTKFEIMREKEGTYTLKLAATTNDYKTLVQQLEALKLAEYAKVTPNQKVDKVKEDKASKLGPIKVDITAPAAIRGILPEDILFDVAPPEQVASSTPKQTP